MIQVLHRTRPVARKEHYCDSCGRVIAKGEKYDRQDNVYDGNLYTYKACSQCEIVASWVYRTDRDAHWEDEGLDLREWLADYWRDTLTIARLWIYFNRKWQRRDSTLVDARTLIPEAVTS